VVFLSFFLSFFFLQVPRAINDGGEGTRIEDNVFAGADTAVHCASVSSGAVIRGNIFGASASGALAAPNAVGVVLEPAAVAQVVVQGNIFVNSLRAGIVVQLVHSLLLQDNLVGVWRDGRRMGNGATGINLQQVRDRAIIQRNVIAHNVGDGIAAGPDVAWVELTDCVASGNGLHGVRVGAQAAIVTNCSCTNNTQMGVSATTTNLTIQSSRVVGNLLGGIVLPSRGVSLNYINVTDNGGNGLTLTLLQQSVAPATVLGQGIVLARNRGIGLELRGAAGLPPPVLLNVSICENALGATGSQSLDAAHRVQLLEASLDGQVRGRVSVRASGSAPVSAILRLFVNPPGQDQACALVRTQVLTVQPPFLKQAFTSQGIPLAAAGSVTATVTLDGWGTSLLSNPASVAGERRACVICECRSEPLAVVVVDCRNRSLVFIPLDMPANTTAVLLSGNVLPSVDPREWALLAALSRLQHLDLSQSQVETVDTAGLRFPALKTLLLEGNELETLLPDQLAGASDTLPVRK
jgi:hypothetical protein